MSSHTNPVSSQSTMGRPLDRVIAAEITAQDGIQLPMQEPAAPSGLGRSYITPDSSVSPSLTPRGMVKQRILMHDSSDDLDDLDMDGFDDDDVGAPNGGSGSTSKVDDSALVEDPATSPTTLADSYLPALFVQHGPCAIRHLTQFLALNNNKFGALGPGQQRRLVVKALQARQGTVFEKVGWGRWNIIEPRMPASATPESMPVRRDGSLLSSSVRASAVPGMPQRGLDSYPQRSSYPHQEFLFSPSLSVTGALEQHEEDVDIDPLDLDMDEDSATDDEDWQAIGPQALRSRTSLAVASSLGTQSALQSSSPRQTGPYPIRRKSGAGIFQMKSPALHPYSSSYTNSPSMSRGSFPKSSSYLKSPNLSSRASSFSTIGDRSSKTADGKTDIVKIAPRGADAEAVEALFMLSASFDERRSQ